MTTWTLDIVEVGVIPHLSLRAYLPGADPEISLDVPCYCYLLQSEEQATLIDSGPDRDASAAAGFTIIGDPPGALRTALRHRGLEARDIDMIIHTHLHYDHMQNDGLFPRARVVVRQRELDWALRDERDRFYVGIGDFLEMVGGRLEIIEGEREVTPGITVVPNGGHTPGHQSILVSTSAGPVCICGDIVPLGANMAVPAPGTDSSETRSFLDRIARSSWEILPGHDPMLRQHRWSN